MSKEKGFVYLLPVILIALAVLIVGFIYFGNKSTNQTAKVDNKNTCNFGSQTVKAPLQSAEGAFTNPLTKIEAIEKITPGSQTGDARLTYLWIKGDQKVPILAPADGVLVKIAYKVRTDLGPEMSVPDYDLTFMVDCRTIYQINHVTDPSSEIVALKANASPHQIKPGSPLNDEDVKPVKNFTVKAGQQLGTTGGSPKARNFDFGIYIDQAAVCPYEKFTAPLRSSWLDLFKEGACEVSGKY